MKQLLLLLCIFQVEAINVLFLKMPTSLSLDRHSCPNVPAPRLDLHGYLITFTSNVSKFAEVAVRKASKEGYSETGKSIPVILPISANIEECDILSFISILNDTGMYFPPNISKNRIDLLIDLYFKLKICDKDYASRFWKALRAAKEYQAMPLDPIEYIKLWLRVFCRYQMPVEDTLWLDLFHAMKERGAVKCWTVDYVCYFMKELNLDTFYLIKNCSCLILDLMSLVENPGEGLVLECNPFMKNNPLYGRFNEIVGIVKHVSEGPGIIMCGCAAHLIPEEYQSDITLYNKRYVDTCICVMEGKRLFVSMNLNKDTDKRWIDEVLIDLLPGQITDLFLRLPSDLAQCLIYPFENATEFFKALAAQPLSNLWIYCDNDKLDCAQLIQNRLRDEKAFLKKSNPENKICEKMPQIHAVRKNSEDYDFVQCKACQDRKTLCFTHWLSFITNHVRKASYEPDEPQSTNSDALAEKSYDLTDIQKAIDEAALKAKEDDSD